jgi:hypothetical protein
LEGVARPTIPTEQSRSFSGGRASKFSSALVPIPCIDQAAPIVAPAAKKGCPILNALHAFSVGSHEPSLCASSLKIDCHPERSGPRFARPTQSKDLRLLLPLPRLVSGLGLGQAGTCPPIFRETNSAAQPRPNPRRESSSGTQPAFHANGSTGHLPHASLSILIFSRRSWPAPCRCRSSNFRFAGYPSDYLRDWIFPRPTGCNSSSNRRVPR